MDEPVTEAILFKQLALQSNDMERRFNLQFIRLEQKFDAKFDKILTLLDGLAKRIDDDDKERAAIAHQLGRHERKLYPRS